MNKTIAYLSTFGAGCALGVLGTKTYFKRSYEMRLEGEISALRAAFSKKSSNNTSDVEKTSKIKLVEDKVHVPLEQQDDISRFPYHTMSKDTDIVKEQKAESEHPEEEDCKGEPYICSVDEYLEDNGYKKVECTWYVDDDTLVDDVADIVMNIFDTVSGVVLDEFGDMVDDVCYIRNEKRREDYEVTKATGAYGFAVGAEDYY